MSRAASSPFFLWVHYYDLHEWRHLVLHDELDGRARYEAVFRDVDAQIARLLDSIDHTLGPQRTAVVLASDHGEYLGERGRWGHTRYVGSPAVHVPLVVGAPGVTPSQRKPFRSLIFGPTLAGFAGASLPSIDGCELLSPECRQPPVHLVASDFQ